MSYSRVSRDADDSLIRDSYTSDGQLRQPRQNFSPTTLTTAKVLTVAERVLGSTLERVKNEGLVGLFEGQGSTRKSIPMVIELRSRIDIEGEAGQYLGVYMREKGDVRGRAHWRHCERPNQVIAFDGV